MTIETYYSAWRTIQEGFGANTDCGEQNVREDFSKFAYIEGVIDFEEMLELERRYEKNNY